MKKYLIIIGVIVFNVQLFYAQNAVVTDDDGYNAEASAMLDVKSTTKGFLAPRMTTTQRDAISSPASGLLVYDTTIGGYYYYNGSAWINLTSGSASGLFWSYNTPNIYMSTSTDKLGLGTSSPLTKLHMYESVSMTDGTDGNLIMIQNSNSTPGVMTGIRFFNGTTANTAKGGVFYRDRLSYGRGDLILANRELSDAVNVTASDARLTIKSEGNVVVEASSAIGINDAIFSVQNPNGDTVFAVYPAGVRIWVDDDNTGAKASGSRGGFAVGGFSPAKAGFTNEFLRVTPDSVRVYIDDSSTTAGHHQGGFAVASFDAVNAAENLMHLSEHNYFIGHNSGNKTQLDFDPMNTDNGLYNVFFGYHAGQENVWGANNILIGYEAGKMNYNGSDNIYIGFQAGEDNDDGYGNIGIGYLSGNDNTSGYRNIFLGRYSGNHNTTGGDNVYIGDEAGEYNQSGNDNVYIGALAGQNGTVASRNVFIGNNAGRYETGSDRLYIDNTSANSTNALIYGRFDTDMITFNGSVGVNTVSPDNALDILGKVSVTQSAGDEMVIINDDVWQHSSGNQDFGDGGDHFLMASKEGASESAGIYGDGDHVTIWSPGDGAPGQSAAYLYILDEDNFNGATDSDPFNNSAVRAYVTTGGVWQVSDQTKKQNIKQISNAMSKISLLGGYTYEFKLNSKEIEKKQVPEASSGILAQELEKVLPEAVQTNNNGDKFVNYSAIVPLLIEGIKEQQQEINKLKQEIEALKGE